MGDSEKEDLSQEETWQEKCNDMRRGMCKQRVLGGIEKSRCKCSGTRLCLRAPGRWGSWSAEAGRPGTSVCGARGPWEGFMFSRGNLCRNTLSVLPFLAWPHNSALYAQTTFCLSIHLLMNIWGFFYSLAITNASFCTDICFPFSWLDTHK